MQGAVPLVVAGNTPTSTISSPAGRDIVDEAAIKTRRWALIVMVAISTCAFIDRAILNTVGQSVKDDLGISDLQLGLLGGAAFSILYGLAAKAWYHSDAYQAAKQIREQAADYRVVLVDGLPA